MPLTAAELVRKAVEHVRTQPNPVHQGGHPDARLAATRQAMNGVRIAEDVADATAWIERSVRVLEDHLHVAPITQQRLATQSIDRLAAEANRAAVRFDQSHNAAADGGLARATFADESKRLAADKGERDIVHCAHDGLSAQQAAARAEGTVQVLDFQERHAVGGVAGHGRPHGLLSDDCN